MKLHFIHIEPNQSLTKLLTANGLEIQVSEKTQKLKTDSSVDLIVFKAEKISDPNKLSELFPNAWVVAIVSVKSLNKVEQSLLKCPGIDDIWLEDSWQDMFFLSLQRMIRSQNKRMELKAISQELKSLRQQIENITKQSQGVLERIERDVSLATQIQRALLPKKSPQIPGVQLSIKYHPSTGAGGDYYDVFSFGDNQRYGLLLADSKTHSMAASLLSVLIKCRLEEMKDRFPDSKSFVEFISREIQSLHQTEFTSLSLLYGILDRKHLNFQYTIAGPLKPILWRMGAIEPLNSAANPPLGDIDIFQFRESVVSLKPGDLLLFHTDGLSAPLSANATQTLEQLLLETNSKGQDALDLQNEVMALVDRHIETQPLKDDFTLIQLSVDENALYIAS